ncbi:carbamoyl phosphate synthase large subunit [Aliidiomarina shirensis]|uniref:Carbamoyl phosphate synthase large subunit n=1 Tax=Aliidiomarina shirensis TaxID=1048642 RepID=A0A432WU73_9GAMM|nr:ATP-grasp domain-containing protein [Aliidiomarina shirensis]RUO37326.1 carbamoyl phosphate synthase large subunit [Aliidiomarina shirensis]
MNVLLTSVGRRSYLVDYFKNALPDGGKVIAANSESLTSGMISADKGYTVPRVDSEEYIPRILEICKLENVTLVVSLFDIDLPYLSEAKSQFTAAGINLVVSEPWVIDVSNDKWKTWQFLTSKNINTPRTFNELGAVIAELEAGTLSFPLIIKPRWGMGSLSIFKVDTRKDLEFFYEYGKRQIEQSYLSILSREEIAKAIVIQEFIAGKEFGLDIFNDLAGNHLQTIAKQKEAMRSGETDMATIVDDARLEQLGSTLASHFKHVGNMDVDVLENSKGELFVLEMNARFGGGYPFSHLAGADFPAALIAMALGKTPHLPAVEFGCTGVKSISLLKAPN